MTTSLCCAKCDSYIAQDCGDKSCPCHICKGCNHEKEYNESWMEHSCGKKPSPDNMTEHTEEIQTPHGIGNAREVLAEVGLIKEKESEECKLDHCHDCTTCGYERPMTEGEAEIAAGLDKIFEEEDYIDTEEFDRRTEDNRITGEMNIVVPDAPDREEWEVSFDDKYPVGCFQVEAEDRKSLKSFIRSTIASARAEGAREAVKQVELTRKMVFVPIAAPMYQDGWIAACNSILNALDAARTKKEGEISS